MPAYKISDDTSQKRQQNRDYQTVSFIVGLIIVHLNRKFIRKLIPLINIGRPVSQEELIEHVWDATADSFSGAIRVHMSSLRKKLKAKLGYDPILNKVGEGYKIREESDK